VSFHQDHAREIPDVLPDDYYVKIYAEQEALAETKRKARNENRNEKRQAFKENEPDKFEKQRVGQRERQNESRQVLLQVLKGDEPEKYAQQRVDANLARRSNSQSINEKQIQRRKKQKTEQTVYWHRRRWADDKPSGTQVVIVQQIFATPQVDPSKLLEVQEGQYLYLLGYSTDGWAQCQTNEL
jgi:hypothetical protein